MTIKCSVPFIEYNTKKGSSSIVSKHVQVVSSVE
jgi:hypothetical protein